VILMSYHYLPSLQHTDRNISTRLPTMQDGKVQGTEKRAARATQRPRKSTQGISIYKDIAAIKVLERASRSFSQCRREKEKRRVQYEIELASVSP